MSFENELKEEFTKIEKMNSRERLVYIRDFIRFYNDELARESFLKPDDIQHIFDRIMLVTKGCDGDGIPALV